MEKHSRCRTLRAAETLGWNEVVYTGKTEHHERVHQISEDQGRAIMEGTFHKVMCVNFSYCNETCQNMISTSNEKTENQYTQLRALLK